MLDPGSCLAFNCIFRMNFSHPIHTQNEKKKNNPNKYFSLCQLHISHISYITLLLFLPLSLVLESIFLVIVAVNISVRFSATAIYGLNAMSNISSAKYKYNSTYIDKVNMCFFVLLFVRFSKNRFATTLHSFRGSQRINK